MTFSHDQFTMSFHQARDIGIDYRDYQKVDVLPSGAVLNAVAGVWGDYQNIRCLFVDCAGLRYLRNIRGGDGKYIIQELVINAKDILVGQEFTV